MDAKTLFEAGVHAIRVEKDLAKGRQLLAESIQLAPDNEMAWLWLSTTTNNPMKQKECLERALAINPENPKVRAKLEEVEAIIRTAANKPMSAVAAVKARQAAEKDLESTLPKTSTQEQAKADLGVRAALASGTIGFATERRATQEAEVVPAKPIRKGNPARISEYLKRAEAFLKEDKIEDAIEYWVRILEIEPDHQQAIENAVRYLSRLKYLDDARELVWKALDAGTTKPSIFLTAIDIARVQGNEMEADDLRLRLAGLPTTSEKVVADLADHFMKQEAPDKALDALNRAMHNHRKSQKILVRRAEIAEAMALHTEANTYYELAAKLGTGTKEGRVADTKLTATIPPLTDAERSSPLHAMREAFGIAAFYILLGWQDAGLNLFRMDIGHWVGVVISLIGGYLLITATSSPQQQPLARLLGGKVPPAPPPPPPSLEKSQTVYMPTQLPILPVAVRFIMGSIGMVALVGAFWLVFGTSIDLLRNPNPEPFYIPTYQELLTDQGE
jgi:tetratricopeptide (TPR) repeat protein